MTVLTKPVIFPGINYRNSLISFNVHFTNFKCNDGTPLPISGDAMFDYRYCVAILKLFNKNDAVKELRSRTKIMSSNGPLAYLDNLQLEIKAYDRLPPAIRNSTPNPFNKASGEQLSKLRLDIQIPGLLSYYVDDYFCEYFARTVKNQPSYIAPTPQEFLKVTAYSLIHFKSPYERHYFLIKQKDIRDIHKILMADSPMGLEKTIKKILQFMIKKRPKSKFSLTFISRSDQCVRLELRRDEKNGIVEFSPKLSPFSIMKIEAETSQAAASSS